MLLTPDTRPSLQLFSPGCGHLACSHCDPAQPPPVTSGQPPQPPAGPRLQLSHQPPLLPKHRASDQTRQPPPLPPKPPWLRTSVTSSAPRPQSYAETSEASESPEAVIYSRSVKLASGTAARSEVGLIRSDIKQSDLNSCSLSA